MKRFFLRGLAALLPTVLTIWIIVALWGVVLDYVARPVTHGIHWTLTTNRVGKSLLESTTPIRIYDPKFVKKEIRDDGTAAVKERLNKASQDSGFFLDLSPIDTTLLNQELGKSIPPAFGFCIGIIGVYFIGLFLGGYVGAFLWGYVERLVFSIPFIKTIYPYAKQIVDFLIGERNDRKDFRAVVAVPYPHPGIYSLGFVTGEGLKTLNEKRNDSLLSVFIPSSPAPVSGFTIFVPATQAIPMNLSVDDAFKVMISAGVIIPPHEATRRPPGEGRLARVPPILHAPESTPHGGLEPSKRTE
jgi:uncharacterized membrane protein